MPNAEEQTLSRGRKKCEIKRNVSRPVEFFFRHAHLYQITQPRPKSPRCRPSAPRAHTRSHARTHTPRAARSETRRSPDRSPDRARAPRGGARILGRTGSRRGSALTIKMGVCAASWEGAGRGPGGGGGRPRSCSGGREANLGGRTRRALTSLPGPGAALPSPGPGPGAQGSWPATPRRPPPRSPPRPLPPPGAAATAAEVNNLACVRERQEREIFF